MAVNLGTRGVAGGARPARVLQPPRRHRLSDLRASPTAPTEPYGIRLWCLGNEMDGPWQIGHKTADGVRPARRRDRAGDAHGRPRPRAGRLRQLQPRDADLRRVGGDGARAHLRRRRLHLAARLLRGARRRPATASSPRAVDMDPSSTPSSPPPTTSGAKLQRKQADQPLLRRVERLVPVAGSRTPSRRPDWPRRAAR